MTTSDGQLAIAVFVKTPGLSKLKTRLAADVGTEKALEFFQLSCQMIQDKLSALAEKQNVQPFWAIAEPAHAEHERQWTGFPRIFQEQGGLGLRIYSIYSQLIERPEISSVALIGADAPQIDFEKVIADAAGTDFNIGPASDGGFYWFCGNQPIPEQTWREVEYSSESTLNGLLTNLKKLSIEPKILSEEIDIDTLEDLAQLKAEGNSLLSEFLKSLPLNS